MPEVLSSRYLEQLQADRAYDGLIWISGILYGCPRFDPDDPSYGLPGFAFDLVERLAWFAQGVRSGAWTYHEATPPERQRAMLARLKADPAHPEFWKTYEAGMRDWRTPSVLGPLDAWIDANDDLNNRIAWASVAANRALIRSLVNTP